MEINNYSYIFITGQIMTRSLKYTYIDLDIFKEYHQLLDKISESEFYSSIFESVPKYSGSIFQAVLKPSFYESHSNIDYIYNSIKTIFSDILDERFELLLVYSNGEYDDNHTNPLTNRSNGFLSLEKRFKSMKNKNMKGLYQFLNTKTVAIIGSRTFNDFLYAETEIYFICKNNNITIEKIISGGASGADKIAESYATKYNIDIEIIRPDWTIGKFAGFLRNIEIVEKSDIVIAFWDRKSKGTLDSINKAKKLNKELYVINI